MLGGCAPAVPLLAGDGHTPAYAVDVGAGGAYRVIVDGVAGEEARGGAVPVAWSRLGLGEVFDMSLGVAGSTIGLEMRSMWKLDEAGEMRLGGAWRLGFDAEGRSYGTELPVLLGFGFDLYELWLGGRFGLAYGVDDEMIGSAGAVVGLAVGIPPVHGMVELTAAYEEAIFFPEGDVHRVVLTPAFALRVRFD